MGDVAGAAMRVLILAVAIGLLAVAWSLAGDLMGPRNVYGAPVAQVHDKLAAMTIPTGDDGPLGAHPVTKMVDKPLELGWNGGSRGAINCTARLEAAGGTATRVAVSCMAEGVRDPVLALAKIAMTEQIDSTLRDRPYNKQAVAIAASAVAALSAVPAANGAHPVPPGSSAAGPAAPEASPEATPAGPSAPPANQLVVPATPVG